MQNYIDTSNNSLAVGLVTIIVVFFLVKYTMENTYKEEDSNKILTYSTISAIFIAIIIMVLYKQMLIYKGTRGMLVEGFYEN